MERDTLRIIDANLNRLREALRLIEDYARFAADDPAAAAALKECRHDVRAIDEACGAAALLDARDIVGDVGRDVKTPAELTRTTSADVVRAAFIRGQEAARVIGEYAKLATPHAARAAEQLRYRLYELEPRIVLRSGRAARLRAGRVYALLTESLCRQDWEATAAQVLAAGAACVQLREKDLSDGELLRRARRLRELTDEHGALLIMNDRPDIAVLARADGVHVGQDDLSVAEARRIAGGELLIGKSTHTPEQLEAALSESPDYVAVGPMFDSTTKPQEHIAGPATLRLVRERTALPLVAIGAISARNAAEVFAAGADCVAVCSAVIGAPDPAAAVRELLHAVPQAAQ